MRKNNEYIGNFSMFQEILTDYACAACQMRTKKGGLPRKRAAPNVVTRQ